MPLLRTVNRHRPVQNWHILPHQHPCCEMVVVMAGCQTTTIADQVPFDAEEGDVVLFKPGVIHEERSTGSTPLDTIFFAFEYAEAESLPVRATDRQGRIRLLCQWLVEERHSLTSPDGAPGNEFLAALLAEFRRLDSDAGDPFVERLRDYIRRHLLDPLSLDDLARHAGMSKYHLVRVWRERTGRTPMAEVRLMRATHARDMILASPLPLKAIAAHSGLSNEVTLSRVIRQCFGTTPGRLRDWALAGSRGDGGELG